jgi:hypothetical protein
MKRITAIATLVLALPFAACGTPRSATVRAAGSQGTAAPAESALFSMPEPTPIADAAPPVVVEIDTQTATVVSRQPVKPVKASTPVTTSTTLDPNEVVWIRDSRGYCGQTTRASADPAAIDNTCPANQPAPLEGHAANPDAEDENDVVYVYEDEHCKPMGRAESGQEDNSPECVGYTEGVAPYDESTTTTTAG